VNNRNSAQIRYIVSGSGDGTIGVWDIAERKLHHRFEQAHSHYITSVAVTNDNKYIVSGSIDSTIRVWDIAERKLLHQFERVHSSTITSVAVTNDNKYIVSGSSDKTIGVWNFEGVVSSSENLRFYPFVNHSLREFSSLLKSKLSQTTSEFSKFYRIPQNWNVLNLTISPPRHCFSSLHRLCHRK
jgi:WD40 repeat protein